MPEAEAPQKSFASAMAAFAGSALAADADGGADAGTGAGVEADSLGRLQLRHSKGRFAHELLHLLWLRLRAMAACADADAVGGHGMPQAVAHGLLGAARLVVVESSGEAAAGPVGVLSLSLVLGQMGCYVICGTAGQWHALMG